MAQSLEGLIISLFDATADRDTNVRETVLESLKTVGTHQHTLLLNSVHAYLARQPKLPGGQRALLLQVMDRVCGEVLERLDDGLAGLIVNLATQEMTMNKVPAQCSSEQYIALHAIVMQDVDDEWQGSASNLLVTMGRRFCNCVMDSLLQKFQPGFTPHCYILYSLGSMAVNNCFGFVPFLSDVMSRTVPMLNSVKSDSLKRAFAISIKQYCESVSEYVSNISEAPDPSVSKDVYASQIAASYDVLLSQWLSSKDNKVRGATVECLGAMCHMMPPEKLHEELRKLIPAILALYKRSVDSWHVTKGLCSLLEASISDESCPVEPYLEEIWVVLFPQVCEEIDYSSPSGAKNQNEVLRCFHVTSTRFADKLVYYLVQKMQSGQEKARLGAVGILRHLINSSGPFMEDKRSLVIIGLRPVLQEAASNRVKKALCQLAVALADHTYLEADGGQLVVEFLVRNLAVPEDQNGKKSSEDVPTQQLRAHCGRALLTMANTLKSTEKLLWPYLFEYVCVESYSAALSDLYRCLAIIARRMNEENRLHLNGPSLNSRLPGPHQILARLFVTLGGPVPDQIKRSVAALQLLRELAKIFHESLGSLWETELGKLDTILEDMFSSNSPSETMSSKQESWSTVILKFVSASVVRVNDGDWRCGLCAAFGKQMHLYNSSPEEKKFLFRCLGGVLAKITNAQFVVDHLELMFRAVNHSSAPERQGCAQGVGYCASAHTDIALTKLENVAKWEHQKKSGGFFGFIKDSIPVRSEEMSNLRDMRATIMLCYGYLLYYCSIETVTQRLEGTVLRFLKPYMDNPKDHLVRESLLQTIDLIAKTVHPTHLKADYTLTCRSQLFTCVKEYVKTEHPDTMSTPLRSYACKAAASLAKLDPSLPENDIWTLCTVLGHHIYPLTLAKDEQNSDSEMLIESVLHELNCLYEEIIKKQPTVLTLTTLMKLVQPWITSTSALERDRSLDSCLILLKTYYAHANDCALGRATEFPLMGTLFGKFCPRFCDQTSEIRLKSLDCVHWTLCLSVLHKGHGKDFQDSVVDGILNQRTGLENRDSHTQLQIVAEMARIIEQRLPPKQMQTYLTVLFDTVLDKQAGVSCAAAALLRHALTDRGTQLQAESEKIVTTILEKLPDVTSVQTYAETLQSLHSFAKHHLQLVLNTLLNQQLPFSQPLVDCWHALARDGTMLPAILEHILNLMEEADQHAFDTPEGTSVKIVTDKALYTAAGFVEVVKGGEPESTIMSYFPKMLATILIHCGCVVGSQFPIQSPIVSVELKKSMGSPVGIAQNGIRTLLLRARTDMLILHMNETGCWKDFEDPLHYQLAITELSKAVALHHPEWIRPLTDLLQVKFDLDQHKQSEPQRIVAAAVLQAFVRKAPNDSEDRTQLLEVLISALMKGLADSSIHVRKLSVRGMGNFAHCSEEELEKYTTTALSAMMAGLEDPGDHKDEAALEAMQGLNKLSAKLSRVHLEKILVSVLLRIRPCFEKESGALRAVSFNLFGQMARFGNCEAYTEQIHTNMISLLLHLNDEEEEVRKACRFALKAIGPLLQCRCGTELIEKEFGKESEQERSLDYNTFLKEFMKVLIKSFSDRLNFYALCCTNYFKSPSTRIKANAALLIGFLLGSAPKELRSTISKELIFAGVSLLLKDPEAEVRLSAAEAIACLHAY